MAQNKLLAAAGLLTAGMGAYHFFLPTQFGWSAELANDAMLRWALLSINSFCSFLLVVGGVLTFVTSFQPRPWGVVANWMLLGMMGFWIFNAVYQFVLPMPLPTSLAKLVWVLRGFAILTAALYAAALIGAPTKHAR
jgi:hypothetical protein